VLARQIKEGAPADIFLSADEAKMNDLAETGLIEPASRHNLLSNTLVIIVPADSKISLAGPSGLADPAVARLALAEPQTVPAGIYAKDYLQRIKLWEQIAPKVIPTENVRGCLAVVESANVDAGIVYKTDALTSNKVRVVFEIPAAVAPRITYQFALLKGSKQAEAATKFAAYLASSDAKAVFEKYGFAVLP
jgi:molybdate transport system substrate-binding protein